MATVVNETFTRADQAPVNIGADFRHAGTPGALADADMVVWASDTLTIGDGDIAIDVHWDGSGSVTDPEKVMAFMRYSDEDTWVAIAIDQTNLTLEEKTSASAPTVHATYAHGGLTKGTTYTIKLSCSGTALKGYLDGTERVTHTQSPGTTHDEFGFGYQDRASEAVVDNMLVTDGGVTTVILGVATATLTAQPIALSTQTIVLGVASATLAAQPLKLNAWYSASWSNRMPITANAALVGGSDTNMDLVIDLNDLDSAAAGNFFSTVDSTGKDIRVTTEDGTTECAVHLIEIDTVGETGRAVFKAPTIDDNQKFYVYYGNASATAPADGDTYGRNAVYSTDRYAVWSPEEGTGTSVADVTGGGLNGTMAAGATWIDGPLGAGTGHGIDFDETSTGEMTVSSFNPPETGGIAFWFRFDTATTTGKRPLGSLDAFEMRCDSSLSGDLFADFMVGGPNTARHFSGPFTQNQWYHLVAMWDSGASTWKSYKDGAIDEDLSSQTIETVGAATLYFGESRNLEVHLDCSYSDIHVFTATKSAQWVGTWYENQNDAKTFWSVGSIEDFPTGGQTIVLGVATATLAAQPLQVDATVPLGVASGTLAAQPLTTVLTTTVALGVNSGTLTAQPLAVNVTVPLGVAGGTLAAQPLAVNVTVPLGVAAGTLTAQPLTVNVGSVIPLGVASGTLAAQPLTVTTALSVQLGVATATLAAQPFSTNVTVPLGVVSPVLAAQPLTVTTADLIALGVAGATLGAQPLTVNVTVPLGVASATITAQPLTVDTAQTVSLGVATATLSGLPLAIVSTLDVTLGVASSTLTAQPLAIAATLSVPLGVAGAVITAQPLAINATVPLGVVSATLSAQPLTVTEGSLISLGIASAVLNALPVVVNQSYSVGVAEFTLSALPIEVVSSSAVALTVNISDENVTITTPVDLSGYSGHIWLEYTRS